MYVNVYVYVNAYIHTIHKYGCQVHMYICTNNRVYIGTYMVYIHAYRVYTYMHGNEDIIHLHGGVLILWHLLL